MQSALYRLSMCLFLQSAYLGEFSRTDKNDQLYLIVCEVPFWPARLFGDKPAVWSVIMFVFYQAQGAISMFPP